MQTHFLFFIFIFIFYFLLSPLKKFLCAAEYALYILLSMALKQIREKRDFPYRTLFPFFPSH